MEPNKKYYFDLPFENHLRKLLMGGKPVLTGKPPSDKQVAALKRFGIEVPATSSEASILIGRAIANKQKV